MKETREFFEKKYAKELGHYRQTTNSREVGCLDYLLDEGMAEDEFLSYVVSIDSQRLFKLKALCQIMFDPENQPPQISSDEAWEKFKEIIGSG